MFKRLLLALAISVGHVYAQNGSPGQGSYNRQGGGGGAATNLVAGNGINIAVSGATNTISSTLPVGQTAFVNKTGTNSTAVIGDQTKQFLTIRSALTAAGLVATANNPIQLQVGNGYYDEGSNTIVLPDYVSILGTGYKNVKIKSDMAGANTVCMSPGHHSVIDGISLVPTNTGFAQITFGFEAASGVGGKTNWVIRNCHIVGNEDCIFLASASGDTGTIEHNIIEGNWAGITTFSNSTYTGIQRINVGYNNFIMHGTHLGNSPGDQAQGIVNLGGYVTNYFNNFFTSCVNTNIITDEASIESQPGAVMTVSIGDQFQYDIAPASASLNNGGGLFYFWGAGDTTQTTGTIGVQTSPTFQNISIKGLPVNEAVLSGPNNTFTTATPVSNGILLNGRPPVFVTVIPQLTISNNVNSFIVDRTSVAHGQNAGILNENVTVATLNNQQWSPSIEFLGNVWSTGAGASQPVTFGIQNETIQAVGDNGKLSVYSSTNNNAYKTDLLTVDIDGNVVALSSITTPALTITGGAHTGWVWTDQGSGVGAWAVSAGGAQTPWTSDINGGGFSLSKALNISATNNIISSNYFAVYSNGTNLVTIEGTNGVTLNTSLSAINGNLNVSGIASITNGIASYKSVALGLTSITFPATTVNYTNANAFNIVMYIDNTGVTGSVVKKNGTSIASSILAGDLVTLIMKPGDYFSETYTVGTPVGKYEPL